MARQPTAAQARELAVVLHDIAWLLPRTIDPWAEAGLDPLPASELEVMRLLVRAPELSVGEVARELGLQPSNASAAIRGLMARGLLERRRDARDGRISRLVPTRGRRDPPATRSGVGRVASRASQATYARGRRRARRGRRTLAVARHEPRRRRVAIGHHRARQRGRAARRDCREWAWSRNPSCRACRVNLGERGPLL